MHVSIHGLRITPAMGVAVLKGHREGAFYVADRWVGIESRDELVDDRFMWRIRLGFHEPRALLSLQLPQQLQLRTVKIVKPVDLCSFDFLHRT